MIFLIKSYCSMQPCNQVWFVWMDQLGCFNSGCRSCYISNLILPYISVLYIFPSFGIFFFHSWRVCSFSITLFIMSFWVNDAKSFLFIIMLIMLPKLYFNPTLFLFLQCLQTDFCLSFLQIFPVQVSHLYLPLVEECYVYQQGDGIQHADYWPHF